MKSMLKTLAVAQWLGGVAIVAVIGSIMVSSLYDLMYGPKLDMDDAIGTLIGGTVYVPWLMLAMFLALSAIFCERIGADVDDEPEPVAEAATIGAV